MFGENILVDEYYLLPKILNYQSFARDHAYIPLPVLGQQENLPKIYPEEGNRND